MIAFSFSRGTATGLVAALGIGVVSTFVAGWLCGVSFMNERNPVLVAARAVHNATAIAAALPVVAAPTQAPITPAPITPAPIAPVAVAQAPAPASHAAAPAQAKVAKIAPPLPPVAAAMEGVLRQYSMLPTEKGADKALEIEVAGDDDLHDQPRELNPKHGKLTEPAPVYTVDIAVFENDMAAERLYRQLATQRYDVYRIGGWPDRGSSSPVAVRIGAYDDRGLAEAVALDVRAHEGLDTRVLRVDADSLSHLLTKAKAPVAEAHN
jgi:hypothetical protein